MAAPSVYLFDSARKVLREIGRNVSTQKYIVRVSYVVITKFVGIPLIMVKQFLYYLSHTIYYRYKYTKPSTAGPSRPRPLTDTGNSIRRDPVESLFK